MPTLSVPLLRNSERSDFLRCQIRWWWKWRRGLTKNLVPHGPLWFGTGVHLALAEWYIPGSTRGREPRETWEEYCDTSIRDVVRIPTSSPTGEIVVEYEDAKELGGIMFDHYRATYGLDDQWEMIAPEQTFSVLIPDPREDDPVALVNYVGTTDGVFRNKNTRRIWLLENKSATQFMFGHLPLDNQAGSYLTVMETQLREMGVLRKNERIAGILYNILMKRKPHNKPKDAEGRYLNKDGSVSKVQPQDTLHRMPITRTIIEQHRHVKRIQTETLQMEPLRHSYQSLMKTPTYMCAYDCDFFELCQVHEGGDDETVERFIELSYKSEDPYYDHRMGAENTKESVEAFRRLRSGDSD